LLFDSTDKLLHVENLIATKCLNYLKLIRLTFH
jgi:hypothetical protein